MNYEPKITLTLTELRNILMEAWVLGWYNKEDTDNHKHRDVAGIMGEVSGGLR